MQLACPNLTQILNGSIQVSTHTLFIYHCSSYEARNFSQSEARFSRGLAKAGFHTHWQFFKFFRYKDAKPWNKFFTKMAWGMWDIDIPSNTNKIADCPDEETQGKIAIEELQLGFRFYADMLNRLMFVIITVIIVFTFFCTFVQSWARY